MVAGFISFTDDAGADLTTGFEATGAWGGAVPELVVFGAGAGAFETGAEVGFTTFFAPEDPPN
jgi:hypothetical protein